MKENRKRFWMCMVDGIGYPKVRHWDDAVARGEAERLAKETNSDVFLLEAVEYVRLKKPTPPLEWKETYD